MSFFIAVGRGLAFVVVVSLMVVATVEWGLVGILLSVFVIALIVGIAFATRSPRDGEETPGHDWHEV